MKTNKIHGASKLATHTLCLAILLTLVGCHKDSDNLFTATTENYNSSKVHIDGNFALWDDGDGLMINGNTYPVVLEGDNHTAKISAHNVSANNGMYYAAYPAASATMSGSNITFDVPYNVKYISNASNQQLVNNMMVAKSSGNHLQFENVGAMLHFSIKGSGNGVGKKLLAIEVSSDVPLSGILAVDMTGETSVSLSGNPTDTARILTFENPYTLTSSAKDFYLNIPAISGATKFRLRYIFNNSGLKMYDKVKSDPSGITLERSSIYHFGDDVYNGTNVQFASSVDGTVISPGSTGKPFRITSSEMFTAASSLFSLSNKEFQLDEDISIGTRTSTLSATLNGNGHTITLTNNISLFETIDGGKVRNLTVAGNITSPTCSNYKYGAIACLVSNSAQLDNCVNKADIICIQGSPTGYSSIVGGICGQLNTSSITNCRNEGTITSDARYTGGVAGYCNGALSTEGCSNNNNIAVSIVSTDNTSNTIYVGGIFGQLTIYNSTGSTHMAENCHNSGSITISESGSNTLLCGGCFGLLSSSADYSMVNCSNTGNITYTTAAVGACFFGGLVGSDRQTANSTMINCFNEGSVSTVSGVNAGGLLGRNYRMNIINCYAFCNIEAKTAAGLVANGLEMFVNTQISNCYYYGTISATTAYGIAGLSNNSGNTTYRMELDHCYYPGNISNICGSITLAAPSCATMASASDASTLSLLNANKPSEGLNWTVRDGHIVFQY